MAPEIQEMIDDSQRNNLNVAKLAEEVTDLLKGSLSFAQNVAANVSGAQLHNALSSDLEGLATDMVSDRRFAERVAQSVNLEDVASYVSVDEDAVVDKVAAETVNDIDEDDVVKKAVARLVDQIFTSDVVDEAAAILVSRMDVANICAEARKQALAGIDQKVLAGALARAFIDEFVKMRNAYNEVQVNCP